MTSRSAAFAIPGDITTLTGGYIYERRLLLGLREAGHDVRHIELAASFPDPTPDDMADAIAQLATLDPERALILDGLVFGATDGLEAVTAPIVAMIHHPLALETGLSEDRRAHLFETERRNLGLARHVLVPSPHTAEILETQYDVAADRITIARPGTDRPRRISTPSEPPLILSVGLLHPRKGHDVLLHALASVTALPWQSVIVGRDHDPSHAASLRALVTDLDLSDRVQLSGTVSRAELDQLYSQAAIFALATRYEGYGIVFDEALSWGLPIISSQTGAVPDTVPEEARILTHVDDPDALGQALRRLLTDADMRRALAQGAAAHGAKLPSWGDTARVASQVLDALP